LSGVKTVVLDSNALMMPFKFKVDIDSEILRLLGKVDVVVPSCVIDELEKLTAPEAKGARKFAQRYRIVPCKNKGDKGVIETAKELRAAVVTNDQELIEILRKSSIPVIRMRGRQRLDFV